MGRQPASALISAAVLLSAFALAVGQRGVTLQDVPPDGTFISQSDAQDQTRTVCTFHLQGAFGGAAAGGVTSASVPGGATALTSATVTCQGGAAPVTIVGGPALAPFAPSFSGVTYRQQIEYPGASMSLSGVDLTIEDSVFENLQDHGPAVLSFTSSKVTFKNCSFTGSNNAAAGAIYANASSDITILDSIFQNNVGGQGGAVSTWDSTILVNGSTFIGNVGDGQGGGLSIRNASTAMILDSIFDENGANNGGGIYIELCGSSVLAGNGFSGNKVQHSGGGLFMLRCSGELFSNIFEKNRGTNGAAIWQNDCPNVSHLDEHFMANVASQGSGGIEMNQGATAVSQCTFTLGKGTKGGGIYMQEIKGDISNSIFENNQVAQFGGGIFRGTGEGDIWGCQFDGNSAKGSGAAIYDSHVVGDIGLNTFGKNTAQRDNSVVFRTESQGQVKSDNRGLASNAVHVDDSTGEAGAQANPGGADPSTADYDEEAPPNAGR